MHDKFKNKSGKANVAYVRIRNNNSLSKDIKHLRIRNSMKCPRSSRISSDHLSIYKDKKFQSNNRRHGSHKHEVLETPHYGGITGKSFIDPEILRCQRAEETLVYSELACQALFQNRPDYIIRAWFTQEVMLRFKKTLSWMAANHKAYHVVENAELTKASGTERHGGVCFLIKKRKGITVQKWIDQAGSNDCILALQDVGNPYNLGAIMRSCAYFGVKGILLQNMTLLESGAAMRTAEGGAEHLLPIASTNIISSLKELRKSGYTIITTSSNSGMPLFKTTLPCKMVLVLSQKHNNLSNVVCSLADLIVFIDGARNVASLNVSVETGVLLSEWWRQNKS